MQSSQALIQLPLATIASFLFVLARVGGLVAFVPIPGFRNAPLVPKVVLAVALSIALLPSWPVVRDRASAPDLSFWGLGAELAMGISAGAVVAWLVEAFTMAMQFLAAQAGYSYAAMIDPATQADSGVLQVFSQLTASMLFFAAGVDRQLLRVFGASLETFPPGSWHARPDMADALIRFSSSMISLSLRIALPLIALLVLIDVALALVGRLQPQLQLLNLAFPAKMLVSMAVIAILAGSFASLFHAASEEMFRTLWIFFKRV